RLCTVDAAFLFRRDESGERLILDASRVLTDGVWRVLPPANLDWVSASGTWQTVETTRRGSVPLNREWVAGRCVLEQRTINVDDLMAEPDSEFPLGRAMQRWRRHRSMIAIPLLRGDEVIGAFSAGRMEVQPFQPDEVALLQAFADQVVIAI